MTDIMVPFEQEGTKAVVRSWLKKVGDVVDIDDPLVELETDKVTQEVPAPAAGVLAEILLDTDAEAVPGAVLGRLDAVLGTSPAAEIDAAPALAEPQSGLAAAAADDRPDRRAAGERRRPRDPGVLDAADAAGDGDAGASGARLTSACARLRRAFRLRRGLGRERWPAR